ncbi:hypothetical protein EYF80_051374 [Liparis tanakae]|uniref:Uncharacterized protein n=1 Tax=Liparis tanakae TaxID=230148 RepID=A0A4Z2FDL1_9TELE|nr:hypothetical protein EYF80_051374 [Liparis tanakae]
MLSQNFFCTAGLSWFRRTRNHLWIFRSSQSTCLERPSSCLVSGLWLWLNMDEARWATASAFVAAALAACDGSRS